MKRLVYGMLIVLGLTAMQAVAKGYDADGDGKVTKQEFCDRQTEILKQKGEELKPGVAEARFEARDVNKDGFLSKEEVAAPAPTKAK